MFDPPYLGNPDTEPFTQTGDETYEGLGWSFDGGGGSITVSGNLTATFTWSSSSGAPPPQTIYVMVEVTASYQAGVSYAGTCTDGYTQDSSIWFDNVGESKSTRTYWQQVSAPSGGTLTSFPITVSGASATLFNTEYLGGDNADVTLTVHAIGVAPFNWLGGDGVGDFIVGQQCVCWPGTYEDPNSAGGRKDWAAWFSLASNIHEVWVAGVETPGSSGLGS